MNALNTSNPVEKGDARETSGLIPLRSVDHQAGVVRSGSSQAKAQRNAEVQDAPGLSPRERARQELQKLMRAFGAGASNDRGMATAEYAIATLAAAGFAGLLITILRSEEVKGFLTKLIESALTVG